MTDRVFPESHDLQRSVPQLSAAQQPRTTDCSHTAAQHGAAAEGQSRAGSSQPRALLESARLGSTKHFYALTCTWQHTELKAISGPCVITHENKHSPPLYTQPSTTERSQMLA